MSSHPAPERKPAPVEAPGSSKEEGSREDRDGSTGREETQGSKGCHRPCKDPQLGKTTTNSGDFSEPIFNDTSWTACAILGINVHSTSRAYSLLAIATLPYSVSLWMIEALHKNISFLVARQDCYQ